MGLGGSSIDLATKALAFFFFAYVAMLAVHFSRIDSHHEASKQVDPWHVHELDPDTPTHPMLKHSHARFDIGDLAGGGDLGSTRTRQLTARAQSPRR